jgi:hypothetical protein
MPGHLQWHADMHRKLSGRSLHFWFMRLSGVYEKDKAFTAILGCMRAVGAVAYAGYELSGEFDVMIRLWLPPSAVGRFAELLKEKLRPRTSRYYPVVEGVRHWVWEEESNGSGPGPVRCDVDKLDQTTLLEDINLLNRLSDVSHEASKVVARNARENSVLEHFQQAKAITPVTPQNGIRLVMHLRPSHDLSDEDLERITEGVIAQLDGLRDSVDRSPAERSSKLRIREFSLYVCADNTVIVLCRIDYRAWHLIREQLLTPLAKIPGLAQTTTFPVLSARLEISREVLNVDGQVRDLFAADLSERIVRKVVPARLQPQRYKSRAEPLEESDLPKPPPGPLAVREFLDREETSTFEAKGSAFSPLDDWLNRGLDNTAEDHGLKEDKGFFRDTIVKSIVAMLNTQGGVILIGALEADRYAASPHERLRLRLESFPHEGRFRLLALQDPTYRRKRWDGFDRKFHDMLPQMIDGMIDKRVQLLPSWHKNREFAFIRVQDPGFSLPRRPFYLKDGGNHRFLIRRGASSKELFGSQIHEFLEDELDLEQEDDGRSAGEQV